MDRVEFQKLARRWVKEGIEQCRVEVFDELLAEGVIDHSAPVPVVGSAGFKARTRAVHAVLRDLDVHVADMIADGDKIAWRWVLAGTHHGPFLGMEPTGRRVTMGGMNIQRVEGGRVAEHWSIADQMGLLHQLKAL
jgi:predicted ester cyclase